MSLLRSHPIAMGLVGLLAVTLVAGCGGAGSSASNRPSAAVGPSGSIGPSASIAAGGSSDPSVAPTKLVVGLGYIPSVQFAQFYLALQQGYYADAGLDVEFQNKIDPDLIPLVGQGAIDVGIGDGTSVIPAVSNGIPVTYVATIYGKFPNIFGGMRVGVTLAVVGAVVGEWAGASKGLAVLINLARGSLFDIPLMFATLLTIALVGVALYLVVVVVERRLVGVR